MNASDHLITRILGVFNGIPYTAPSQVFVSLSYTDPGKNGATLSEPSYQGYSRMPITFSTPSAMGGGVGVQNDHQITFAKAPTDQGTVTFATLHDSQIGGNMLAYKQLNTDKTLKAESSPTFLAGESRWWWTGNMSTSFMTQLLGIFKGVSIPALNAFATLFNGSPEAGGAELVGGGFSRKMVTFGSPVQQPGGQFTISNTDTVAFDSPTISLGVFDTDVVMDAGTGGRVLLFRTGPQDAYSSGDQINYMVGDLIFSLN